MVWVGRDIKNHLVPTPLPRTGTSFIRLLKATSNLTLNTSNMELQHEVGFSGSVHVTLHSCRVILRTHTGLSLENMNCLQSSGWNALLSCSHSPMGSQCERTWGVKCLESKYKLRKMTLSQAAFSTWLSKWLVQKLSHKISCSSFVTGWHHSPGRFPTSLERCGHTASFRLQNVSVQKQIVVRVTLI